MRFKAFSKPPGAGGTPVRFRSRTWFYYVTGMLRWMTRCAWCASPLCSTGIANHTASAPSDPRPSRIMRDTPSVLIGAFDNPWTLRTADQLRFTFRKDSEKDIGIVHDSQHAENSQWRLTRYWPNWDVPVDYAIVTRMVDSTTDRPVIIAAGLTQYGTIGAGEFISNPRVLLGSGPAIAQGLAKEESADRAECPGGEPHFRPPPDSGDSRLVSARRGESRQRGSKIPLAPFESAEPTIATACTNRRSSLEAVVFRVYLPRNCRPST